jgi:FAD:protein FMN transferase
MLPLLFALLIGASPPRAEPPAPGGAPRGLGSQAFGKPVEIEVRDLPPETARQIVEKALAEISDVERLTDANRPDGSLAALNAAAGKGPQPVDARMLAVLVHASDFCSWSEGAHGPLGRDLYALWGLRAAVPDPPTPERLQQAVNVAACSRLVLDAQQGTAALAAGSGLDLWGFAEGLAVDRAVEILRQGGAGNGFVRIGAVQRGFGLGPAGKGWPVALPQMPGQEEPAGQVYLRDRSLAVAAQSDHPLQSSGSAGFPYVNQRTGLPAKSVLAAAVLTEVALDAEGLAAALLIAGPREGQLRLGSLRPRPSVLWFMGSGTGAPLQVGYRWSEVSRR